MKLKDEFDENSTIIEEIVIPPDEGQDILNELRYVLQNWTP